MIIRQAQIEDAPEIAHVHIVAHLQSYKGILPQEHLDSLPSHYRKRLDVWREFIEKPPSKTIMFVVESDTGLVGFAHFGPARDEQFKDYGELNAIYLLDTFKRQKTGWQLLQSGMQSLSCDFNKAYCWVLQHNVPAIRFYEKSGAVFSGQTKDFERQGQVFTEQAYIWPDLTKFR